MRRAPPAQPAAARSHARGRCGRHRGRWGRSTPRPRVGACCPARHRTMARACERAHPRRPRRATASSPPSRVTRWLDAWVSAGVVDRARQFGDPDRFAADLEHECFSDWSVVGLGGDAEDGAVETVEILGTPGERHRRVQRQRDRSARGGGVENADPVGARRVGHQSGRRARRRSRRDRTPADGVRRRARSPALTPQLGTTSSGGSNGTSGSNRWARRTDSFETPLAATTWCPTRRKAAPRTAPTRPVPTTPTVSRTGSDIAASHSSLDVQHHRTRRR